MNMERREEISPSQYTQQEQDTRCQDQYMYILATGVVEVLWLLRLALYMIDPAS